MFSGLVSFSGTVAGLAIGSSILKYIYIYIHAYIHGQPDIYLYMYTEITPSFGSWQGALPSGREGGT